MILSHMDGSVTPFDPLTPTEAKALLRRLLERGRFKFIKHALDEMAKDELEMADCVNVLRAGMVGPPEDRGPRGELRYQVQTARICVVVQFQSEDLGLGITVWRKNKDRRR